MAKDIFRTHMIHLVESIEDCCSLKRILPCLILLYSGIDAMAELDSMTGDGVRKRFVRWTDKYVIAGKDYSFSALDLYAARCGVVHSFSPDSDLSRSGAAKRINYAWGNADAGSLGEAAKVLGAEGFVNLHIRELIDAFRNAVADYLSDLDVDVEAANRFKGNAGRWFAYVSKDTMDDLLGIAASTNHEGSPEL